MAKLDYNYIASLVEMAQHHDSNAFAELYAATYHLQYDYAYYYLQDELEAQYAVQETYVQALQGLYLLTDHRLFLPWLNQLNFRICLRMDGKRRNIGTEPEAEPIRIEGQTYSTQQILGLPFTEAQSLILFYHNGMRMGEIARLMDVRRGTVRRGIRSGIRHLRRLTGKGGEK